MKGDKIGDKIFKAFVKVGGTVGLAAIIYFSSFMFTGCDKKDDINTKPSNPPAVEVIPSEDPPQPSEDQPSKDDQHLLEIHATIQNFFDNVDNNYSYQKSAMNCETLYKLGGENFYHKNTATGEDCYYIVEDGIAYQYTFDATDEKYHKTFATSTFEMPEKEVIDDIYADLLQVDWKEYDEETQICSGTLNGDTVTFKVEEGIAFIGGDGWTSQVFDVGSTNVNAPASELVVDETKEEESYIWSEEEGYAYNIPLLAQTIETWIKENDATTYFGITGGTLQKVAWVVPDKTKILFYALTKKEDGTTVLTPVKTRIALTAELEKGTIKTVKDLVDYMDQDGKNFNLNGESIRFEYTSLDYTAEQKAELDTMTENILNRLGTIGYQEGSIKNEGTPVDLSNATILWAGKTAAGGTSAGGDIGFCREFDINLLVEQNGQLKFVTTVILSSTDAVKDEKQHVLNNDDYGWFVGIYKEAEIDKENLSLWQEQNAKTYSYTQEDLEK